LGLSSTINDVSTGGIESESMLLFTMEDDMVQIQWPPPSIDEGTAPGGDQPAEDKSQPLYLHTHEDQCGPSVGFDKLNGSNDDGACSDEELGGEAAGDSEESATSNHAYATSLQSGAQVHATTTSASNHSSRRASSEAMGEAIHLFDEQELQTMLDVVAPNDTTLQHVYADFFEPKRFDDGNSAEGAPAMAAASTMADEDSELAAYLNFGPSTSTKGMRSGPPPFAKLPYVAESRPPPQSVSPKYGEDAATTHTPLGDDMHMLSVATTPCTVLTRSASTVLELMPSAGRDTCRPLSAADSTCTRSALSLRCASALSAAARVPEKKSAPEMEVTPERSTVGRRFHLEHMHIIPIGYCVMPPGVPSCSHEDEGEGEGEEPVSNVGSFEYNDSSDDGSGAHEATGSETHESSDDRSSTETEASDEESEDGSQECSEEDSEDADESDSEDSGEVECTDAKEMPGMNMRVPKRGREP